MASETDPVSIQSEREEAVIEYVENEENVDEVEHEEEPEDEGENYINTSLSATEDPEQQRSNEEYDRLVQDISFQNHILEQIKRDIQDITSRSCPTIGEKRDLKKLYRSLDKEMKKLQCLIEKAIRLQNFGSKKHYKEFSLATTFDEDNMNPIVHTCETLQVQSLRGQTKHKLDPYWRASGGDLSEMDKSCSFVETNDRCHKESQLKESEEKKLLKEILTALKDCDRLKTKSRLPRYHSKKNDSIEQIKNKINRMQQTISELREELCKYEIESNPSDHCPHKINQESNALKPATDPLMMCLSKKGTKADNFKKLNDNYLYLLTEFSKKDEQLKELNKKLRNSCEKCRNIGDANVTNTVSSSADQSELHLLRNRINEMKEEQIEFKCLMREQSLQLDEYRNKYLSAQQKVEEQCALLEKLNMNNKRIEKQINLEIKEIRTKFQERLNDLLKFPRLLENEQIKLAQTCKEKEELESKLIVVCKELKNLKSKTISNNEEDCKPELKRCQQELCQAKKNLEEMQNQRDLLCDQLRTTVEDLDTLRSESAKIIARTKERAEHIKQKQQDQIDRLEKQLAQCRAAACLSVTDREAVIREMQGQLNTLSYSFDAAQKQIKTLRNHIAYMSNEKCFPSKC